MGIISSWVVCGPKLTQRVFLWQQVELPDEEMEVLYAAGLTSNNKCDSQMDLCGLEPEKLVKWSMWVDSHTACFTFWFTLQQSRYGAHSPLCLQVALGALWHLPTFVPSSHVQVHHGVHTAEVMAQTACPREGMACIFTQRTLHTHTHTHPHAHTFQLITDTVVWFHSSFV